jgi:hypothetical protein
MGLEAPSEEAYLQRLLTVQQHERRTAMALADAPAMPQLEWEGDIFGSELSPANVNPVVSNAPTSTAASGLGMPAAAHPVVEPQTHQKAFTGPQHFAAAAPAPVAVRADSSSGDDVGLRAVAPERLQPVRRPASKRRDSSRSDASVGQEVSSGRSETTGRVETRSLETAGRMASPGGPAAEPSTPDKVSILCSVRSYAVGEAACMILSMSMWCTSLDAEMRWRMQVTTPPQRAQRLVAAARVGSGLAGEDVLPPSPLEHEMCGTQTRCLRAACERSCRQSHGLSQGFFWSQLTTVCLACKPCICPPFMPFNARSVAHSGRC